MAHDDHANALRETLQNDDVREWLDSLAQLVSAEIEISGPEGLSLIAGHTPSGGRTEISDIEVNAHPVKLSARYTEILRLDFPVLEAVIQPFLEQRYAMEDVTSGLLECTDYQNGALHTVECALHFPELKEIVSLFLRKITDEFGPCFAFVALKGYSFIWSLAKHEFTQEPTMEELDIAQDELSELLRALGMLKGISRPSMLQADEPSSPAVLRRLSALCDARYTCTAPVQISSQPALGAMGVCMREMDLNSVKCQRMMMYVSLMAGAIASVAHQRVEEDRQAAVHRQEAFEQSAARTAHKVKNPIFFILGELDLLKRDMVNQWQGVPEKITQRLEKIADYARRVQQITEEFQKLAQEMHAARQIVDLAGTLRSMVREIVPDGGKYVITEFSIPESPPEVRLDKELFRSIFEEILGNSLRIMAEGGELTISLAGPHKPGNHLFPQLEKKYYLITLCDSGPGVPEEEKEKIFEPFYTTRADGTGLGLAIVRKYCGLMGWLVKEDGPGESGRGARFRIGIPAED